MKNLITTCCILFLSLSAFSQALTDGTWYTADKDARVKFYETSEKVYGKIIWMKEPTKDGKPKVDNLNPDKSKRNVPLQDFVFLKGFEKDGKNEWDDGTIYDPQSGKTYSSSMELENVNKLNVRGYIGISLIGRTSTFTRATSN
ncbi:MAG: hypothetical protein ACJA1O_002969 [Spirosomataceae bacterium]|jgi:uncharacterized protein (DUF2147 family)